jgi:hypothetical protein
MVWKRKKNPTYNAAITANMRRKILNNFIRDSYLKEVLEGKYLEIMFT